jgi:hypothetical protein
VFAEIVRRTRGESEPIERLVIKTGEEYQWTAGRPRHLFDQIESGSITELVIDQVRIVRPFTDCHEALFVAGHGRARIRTAFQEDCNDPGVAGIVVDDEYPDGDDGHFEIRQPFQCPSQLRGEDLHIRLSARSRTG